jgi:GT2 family glycosyltransferase
MEDVDLAYRARLSGWNCRYVPAAQVIHEHGGTAGVNSATAVYFGNRNLLWYTVKNHPIWIFLCFLPWIIGRNCADIPYYIRKGKGRAILLAKIDAIKGLLKMVQKRKEIKRTVPYKEIMKWIG